MRSEPISKHRLAELAKNTFGDMIKAVVDVERELMAVDMELHADGEMYLIENGSEQANLWGINLHPGQSDEHFVEFDSLINMRPFQGNRSRGVEDKDTQEQIIKLVNTLVTND
ncbi:hypothetical protein IPJ72_03165 [Candidatus Peregrinibacteria bacterium]|nr:MAG: hypothetical protein IPJ72_03165 [Candidatus Peregrinibacteria bacterium]